MLKNYVYKMIKGYAINWLINKISALKFFSNFEKMIKALYNGFMLKRR